MKHQISLEHRCPKNEYSKAFLIPTSGLLLALTQVTFTQDQDPLRNWILQVFKEDTIYYPLKSNIVIDTISDHFIQARTARWKFAWQIYNKEYNRAKKIFGGGFNYLNWYGYHFKGGKTVCDWPHNPFLSVLLYSGIVGLSLYFFLIYKVFYYYIKYVRKYPLFFIFFLLTFFFSFFSANSPFTPPIMGFFVMLPFFIHYIEQKKSNIVQSEG